MLVKELSKLLEQFNPELPIDIASFSGRMPLEKVACKYLENQHIIILYPQREEDMKYVGKDEK